MSSNDVAVAVRGLSKSYSIAHNTVKHTTLSEALVHRAKNPFQRVEKETFWALKDIEFDIKKGDVVGIIGRNGAGKSTLLKVLSQITEPTKGEVRLYGRVGSLLEVGTGFHPELTGRENIYLNGAILGMRRSEIDRQFDAIVDFAEVEPFLDTPVKRYSSGMYVRLAFAVAAHLNPEILVVDEVLAVGDAQFQQKCLGKMEDVAKTGRTVLYVSHNTGTVQSLCNRALLLQNGRITHHGEVGDVITNYLQTLVRSAQEDISERTDRRGKGETRFCQVKLKTSNIPSEFLVTGMPASFIFQFSKSLPAMSCRWTLFDQHGHPITHLNSAVSSVDDVIDSSLHTTYICEVDNLPLLPGIYRMNVALMTGHEIQDRIEAALTFEVEPGQINGRPMTVDSGPGCVAFSHRWRLCS